MTAGAPPGGYDDATDRLVALALVEATVRGDTNALVALVPTDRASATRALGAAVGLAATLAASTAAHRGVPVSVVLDSARAVIVRTAVQADDRQGPQA